MSAQRVCSVQDVPTDTNVLRVDVPNGDGTVPVAVARDADGELHAVSDICSHQNVSLSEGEVDDCSIECWLHGSQFDLRTGEPSALPAVSPIPVYRLEVRGDDVWVDVSATVPAVPEPATSKEN